MGSTDTDREFSANFDRQASASNSVLFLGLSSTIANKTVSFFASFHRAATQSGTSFLVSIARATVRRIYHSRPRLSELGHFRGYSFSSPPPVGGPSVERIRFDDSDSSLTTCVDSANLSAEKLVAPFPLLSLSLHSYPGAG